jgi:hypothetical protein
MRYGPNVQYCPTARNFYRIRRVLMETLGLPREAIRLTSTLAELIPPQERRRLLDRFRQDKLKVFDLSFSSRQLIAMFLGICTLLLGVPVAVVLLPLLTGSALAFACGLLALFGSLAAGYFVHVLEKRPIELDPTYTLKQAVVRATKVQHYLDAGYEMTLRDEIFLKVRDIVARHAGVDPEKITEETNFTDDIGAE